MKRISLIVFALIATMMAMAQNIAVVNPSNETTIYQTLDEAILEAEGGSTIYLPGGGFQVKDETQIDRKVTIMGVSHRGDTDNVDGATIISGNLNFVKGSSGSSVIGVYLSGDINVGTEDDYVNNLTIRLCNINSVQVKNSQSSGMIVNQCYLRNKSCFGKCNVRLDNNIIHSLFHINGGTINHNILVYRSGEYGVGPKDRYGVYYCHYHLGDVYSSTIINNFILFSAGQYQNVFDGGNCIISNNCIGTDSWGDASIILDAETTWDDVFKANKGVNIYSDYNLIGSWGKKAATDGTDIGIFGGSGFKDKDDMHAPIPRIVSKKVDEQTDGSGKLHIEVTIKAK